MSGRTIHLYPHEVEEAILLYLHKETEITYDVLCQSRIEFTGCDCNRPINSKLVEVDVIL